MAQSFTILQNSFKHFGQGHYKESMEELQKFKQLKEQSDQNQSMVQINENIILCEYNITKDANACINKLDEIIDEIKKPSPQKKKKQEDDSILQFNKAIMFFLSGKVRQAHNLLKYLKDNYNLDIYLNIKVHLLLVETSFQLQEFLYASELYKKLSSEDTLKSLQNKITKSNQVDDQQQQSQSIYTSLLLGSDLPYPDAHPNTFSKEEFLFILNVIKFRFYIVSNTKDWNKKLNSLEQAFKTYMRQLDQQSGMQQDQAVQFSAETQPYLNLHSQMMFQQLKAQRQVALNENVGQCIKMINPCAEKQNQQNQDFIQSKQSLYLTQIYNNLGCVHAKLGKYALAAVYFHKAITQTRQVLQSPNLYESVIQTNVKQRQFAIYQNLADALFMDQKYQKALNIYNQLQEACNQSAKFWYNRGVCYIQLYHEFNPDKNEIYEISEEHSQINTQEEGKKIILQSREIYSDADEEYQDQFYKIDQKSEENKLVQPKVIKELLNNAIKSFRNAIILSKKEKREETIQIDQEQLLIAGSQLFESSIVFLTYAYLCRGDYNLALQQGKEALEYNLSDSNKYTIIQYVLEAYISTSKIKEATSYLNSNGVANFLNKFINCNLQVQCRNVIGIQTTCFSSQSPKAISHFNQAALHLHNNHLPQAWNSIQSLMSCCDITINQINQVIPVPFLNLLIWYYLKSDQAQLAIHLIKRRRLLTGQMGKNKISLLNITK
ncbi:unnamed protein product (macronuclear) [Paramecium tetraurelia]|uniref:Uncharacterized protein n=1 Tax=Paramecium tetraurelia TaxID=5888 RepID=A0DFP9_PARTE|nr:uncharacterized protein GSPATT00016679001 [Paramecium tetraurelia]CAK81866.1 unnamed protein product [Paramecium tetraurelia]|eukprot:XP_001449263.1 hypothetical protein (macronuclear) [Paramecium tetraurelia strain d4-2]